MLPSNNGYFVSCEQAQQIPNGKVIFSLINCILAELWGKKVGWDIGNVLLSGSLAECFPCWSIGDVGWVGIFVCSFCQVHLQNGSLNWGKGVGGDMCMFFLPGSIIEYFHGWRSSGGWWCVYVLFARFIYRMLPCWMCGDGWWFVYVLFTRFTYKMSPLLDVWGWMVIFVLLVVIHVCVFILVVISVYSFARFTCRTLP